MEKDLLVEIEIPANTTATVYLPAADVAALTEGGKPLAATPDIRTVPAEKGWVGVKLGSGAYRFVVKSL
jgi:alpha-L-rhamnosidase